MHKVNMTVGQCLVVLLWLPVLAASEASAILKANLAFFAVATSPTTADGVSAVASDHHQSAAVRDFERSLAKVQPLLERYGYGAAVVAVMVEGIGIPMPGQTLLMASAMEAGAGAAFCSYEALRMIAYAMQSHYSARSADTGCVHGTSAAGVYEFLSWCARTIDLAGTRTAYAHRALGHNSDMSFTDAVEQAGLESRHKAAVHPAAMDYALRGRQLRCPALPPCTAGQALQDGQGDGKPTPSLATNRLLSDKIVHRRRSIGTESVTVSG